MKYLALLLVVAMSFIQAYGQKVLYITHEPGKSHEYTPQKEIFVSLGKEAGWKLTVSSGTHDDQLIRLEDPQLCDGYDVVVYNFCFAKTLNLNAASNIIDQTRNKGVPALVIHCAMHSFWASYKGSLKKGDKFIQVSESGAMADAKVYEDWKKQNPHKVFPVWGDFTGVASTSHGAKAAIKVTKCCAHESTTSVPKAGYTTAEIAELYNNFYILDSVKPLLKGTQVAYPNDIARKRLMGKKLTEAELAVPKQKSEAVVMWQVPQGKSELIGLSLGHDISEWQQIEFQNLIKDSVKYLYKNNKKSK